MKQRERERFTKINVERTDGERSGRPKEYGYRWNTGKYLDDDRWRITRMVGVGELRCR